MYFKNRNKRKSFKKSQKKIPYKIFELSYIHIQISNMSNLTNM